MTELKRQRGFIMAEVVLAIMVIGIALVTVSGMFIQSTRANKGAAEYTVATSLAQKQLELLKCKPYSYWASPPASIDWQDTAETVPLTINGVSYSVTTTAATSSEDSNLTEVTVVVSWSQQEQPYDVQLTTFYSKI